MDTWRDGDGNGGGLESRESDLRARAKSHIIFTKAGNGTFKSLNAANWYRSGEAIHLLIMSASLEYICIYIYRIWLNNEWHIIIIIISPDMYWHWQYCFCHTIHILSMQSIFLLYYYSFSYGVILLFFVYLFLYFLNNSSKRSEVI